MADLEVMCRAMPNKVIPFPKRPVAPRATDQVLLTVRRKVVITVGGRQFQVDMTAKVRPLKTER
jgi:hypothetical protein